jgi:hypothetical protein
MTVPHRGARAGRSLTLLPEFAPRKRAGLDFVYGTCECTAEVVVRSRVAAWKTWATIAQDGRDLWRGRAPVQQLLSDPFIGDAPVRLWKALENPQPMQPNAIDAGCTCGWFVASPPVGIDSIAGNVRRNNARRQSQVGRAVHTAFGLFQQSSRLGRQAWVGVQDLHPRRITAAIASMWFLIGKPSQTAQMTPIGAGQVPAIGVSQLLADEAGDERLDRGGADLNPGLEIAGAGLEQHTRFVPVAPHGFENRRAVVIQIDENVARVAFRGVGLDVHVAAFPVASSQKSHSGGISQLRRGPQSLSGKRSSGLAVDETDEVEIVRHGRELAAHALHGEIESEIEHGPNFRIEGTGSTITFQRTVISGLTDCLNLGVHRNVAMRG